MSSDGDVAMVWSATTSPDKIVRASVRPSGGSFSPPTDLSATRSGIYRPTVTIDEGGGATAVWTRPEAGNEIVEAAGRDAVPPGIRDLSIPDSGTVGTPVPFSCHAFRRLADRAGELLLRRRSRGGRECRLPRLLGARHLHGRGEGERRGGEPGEHRKDALDSSPDRLLDRKIAAEQKEGHCHGAGDRE